VSAERSTVLHRYTKFLAGCTILLILAGSLVTSNGAGLSVPDWPTTYGWNLFTFPPSMWVANIFYEHGHRLIASAVGFLTVLLVIWLWLSDAAPWVRRTGAAALSAVIAQGILGGVTVLFFLPPAVSTAHAALAEIFFCLIVSLALFTSPGWNEPHATVDDRRLRGWATATTLVIYAQILIGATMRHTGAGLAIPDFPWMFGHVIPDRWSQAVAIHFAHRLGAIAVVIATASLAAHIWRHHASRPQLAVPAVLLLLLVLAQLTFGALNVLSGLRPWVNSAHVVVGALVLTTSLVVTLRSWQSRFPAARADRAARASMNTFSLAANAKGL